MKEITYIAPESISEALKLLTKHKGKAVIFNGGTDVMIRLRENLIQPDYVIDIKRIPGLKEITFKKDGLHVGCCATMNEIAEHADVRKYYPYYAKACASVGSKQVRNRATCIGNIVNASPLADSATPLYAMDAVLLIEGPEGKREVPVREFITFVRKTVLAEDEIVLGVRVPYIKGAKGVYTKNSRRKEVDLSNVCATVVRTGDEYRIAFGSVAPTPKRLEKTEKLLNGKKITPALIEKAKQTAVTEVAPIDDVRASKVYRLDIVQAIIENSLLALGR